MDRIPDMLKRLHTIENILFNMVDVIDIARNYDERLKSLEHKPKGRKTKMDATETMLNIINAKNVTIRKIKIQEAYAHYHALIHFLKQQPCDPVSMNYAYVNLDQGMHWVEKIFEVTGFVPTPMTSEPQGEVIENDESSLELSTECEAVECCCETTGIANSEPVEETTAV